MNIESTAAGEIVEEDVGDYLDGTAMRPSAPFQRKGRLPPKARGRQVCENSNSGASGNRNSSPGADMCVVPDFGGPEMFISEDVDAVDQGMNDGSLADGARRRRQEKGESATAASLDDNHSPASPPNRAAGSPVLSPLLTPFQNHHVAMDVRLPSYGPCKRKDTVPPARGSSPGATASEHSPKVSPAAPAAVEKDDSATWGDHLSAWGVGASAGDKSTPSRSPLPSVLYTPRRMSPASAQIMPSKSLTGDAGTPRRASAASQSALPSAFTAVTHRPTASAHQTLPHTAQTYTAPRAVVSAAAAAAATARGGGTDTAVAARAVPPVRVKPTSAQPTPTVPQPPPQQQQQRRGSANVAPPPPSATGRPPAPRRRSFTAGSRVPSAATTTTAAAAAAKAPPPTRQAPQRLPNANRSYGRPTEAAVAVAPDAGGCFLNEAPHSGGADPQAAKTKADAPAAPAPQPPAEAPHPTAPRRMVRPVAPRPAAKSAAPPPSRDKSPPSTTDTAQHSNSGHNSGGPSPQRPPPPPQSATRRPAPRPAAVAAAPTAAPAAAADRETGTRVRRRSSSKPQQKTRILQVGEV